MALMRMRALMPLYIENETKICPNTSRYNKTLNRYKQDIANGYIATLDVDYKDVTFGDDVSKFTLDDTKLEGKRGYRPYTTFSKDTITGVIKELSDKITTEPVENKISLMKRVNKLCEVTDQEPRYREEDIQRIETMIEHGENATQGLLQLKNTFTI